MPLELSSQPAQLTPPASPLRPQLAPGTLVDHFRVRRRIGRGGMGEVYLARDLLLGRKVALKIVRRLASSAPTDLAARVLQEARTTARFNHPNIVTIYAVGEHEGVPYLALEYLEGTSLRERIAAGVGPREAPRLGLALAEALAEAHQHGVLHLDLKPENVLIPRDGRPRVCDFGLSAARLPPPVELAADGAARRSDPALAGFLDEELWIDSTQPGAGSCRPLQGTPAYMAPEQWRQEQPGEATDVWALGVILFEMASGDHPYPASTLGELMARVAWPDAPPRLPVGELGEDYADLVNRCLTAEPAARPSAREVAETLRELLASARSRGAGEEAPFRGLQAYSEQHAHLFFGRGAEVAALVERLRDTPALAVVGPSGVGKSSFIQAGLIPRLREQGRWIVLTLRPGTQPFRALASRLRAGELPSGEPTLPLQELLAAAGEVALEPDGVELEELLRRAPHLVSVILERLATRERARVLLFVDQLEELCTHTPDEGERRAFMEAVCGAADDAGEPVRVVFTLREDFLGRLAGGPRVREALGQVVLLGPPDRRGFEEVLVEPLRALDYGYDDAQLVPRMIEAAGGELPLLQFTARQLWERRDWRARRLTRRAYEEMGGVEGALAAHADGVLEGLTPDEEQLARELLLRLISSEGTRRLVPLPRLLEGLDRAAEPILGRLVKARLLSVRRARGVEGAGQPELELVHESLIHNWTRLARWIERSGEDLAFLDDVGQAAEVWERRGQREEELWTGQPLWEALAVARRCSARVPSHVARFLEAGHAREGRRQRRRRVVTASLLALTAALAAIFAGQWRDARQGRSEARGRFAEALREGARAAALRGDLLEARAKVRGALEARDSAEARVLWWRLERDALLWRKDLGAAVYGVAFSPDGQRLAAACQDRAVHLIEADTGEVRALRGHGDQVMSVAVSPSGHLVAAGTWGGAIYLHDLVRGVRGVLRGHRDAVRALAFSPDGQRLLSGSSDRTARLWEIEHPDRPPLLLAGHGDGVHGAAFAPDGRRVATASLDQLVRIWAVSPAHAAQPAQPSLVLRGHQGVVLGVAFSPDGKMLASVSTDRTLRLWDVERGVERRMLEGHTGGVSSVAFGPDGKVLASSSLDGTVRLWTTDGATRGVLTAGKPIYAVRFSPDGTRLVSSGSDNAIRLWRVSSRPAHVAHGHNGRALATALSPDDRVLATGGHDGTIRLWDTSSGEERSVLEGHTAAVHTLTFAPGGKLLASGSADGTTRLWELSRTRRPQLLGSSGSAVYTVAFSPDGRRLASGGNDSLLRLWDVTTGAQQRVLEGHADAVTDVRFSPDGKLLASASRDRSVRLWPLAGGEPRLLEGHTGAVRGVAFSPDGRQLASAGDDARVWLWELAESKLGERRLLTSGASRTYSLAFSPRGLLGVPRADGSALLLDPSGRAPARELRGHAGEVNVLRFSADGATLATASDDGTARLWRATDGTPLWRAPLLLTSPARLLTHRGWQALEPADHAAPPPQRWREAAEQARGGDQAEDLRTICLRSERGLELWDKAADQRDLAARVDGLRRVLALPGACVALAGSEAHLYTTSGLRRRLPATAVAWDGREVLVSSERQVLAFSPAGDPRGVMPGAEAVTALTRAGNHLALGFEDGSIELTPLDGGQGRRVVCEDTPSSPVTRLAAGPGHTLVAGHASGAVGLWQLESGARLEGSRLHGPVTHLRVRATKVFAATDLGDHLVLDLSVFDLEYCQLLRQVWREVPVEWSAGRPAPSGPPAGHRCAPREP